MGKHRMQVILLIMILLIGVECSVVFFNYFAKNKYRNKKKNRYIREFFINENLFEFQL